VNEDRGGIVAVQTPVTAEEFDRLAEQPENADKRLEFIGGEVVEVPSNACSSELAITIAAFIKQHLRESGLSGHVTGEGGGYMVSGERYAPDVAYLSKARQAELAKEGYNPNPPQLAVEVMSPNDDNEKLLIKVSNYLAAGTLVWVVRPASQKVEVHAPGQPVKVLGIKDMLDGGKVLPGFKLAVKEIFST
jgi:Uma2 family endonuclease